MSEMRGDIHPRTIVLAAGGTGGHIFPAEALARVLSARGHHVHLITDRRGAAFGGLPADHIHRIHSAAMGRGLFAKARTAATLVLGYVEARRHLRRLGPDAVVGFGGFPSAPTAVAASHIGAPLLLHEQNALAGRVNRRLARYARRICVSFPRTRGFAVADSSLAVTGNPVRPAVVARAGTTYRPSLQGEPFHLLVTGGSQGAGAFADLVPGALAALPRDLRGRLRVTQQCRPEDLTRVRACYADLSIAADLDSFFPDIPERLVAAQLAVMRAGASTVSELAVVGRPAFLIPYPFAMDDHQTVNAHAFESAGAGWTLPQNALTAEDLAARLAHAIGHPEELVAAAHHAAQLGVPDAAERLADATLDLIRQEASR